jgi:hypothetical protein
VPDEMGINIPASGSAVKNLITVDAFNPDDPSMDTQDFMK